MRGRLQTWVVIAVFAFVPATRAQDAEAGRIERSGDQAILVVDSPRPMDSAAITLAREFGIAVSVEDPPYIYLEDVQDVTAAARRNNPPRRLLVPKGGRLEISFSLGENGAPRDLKVLLQDLAGKANALLPFAYTVLRDGDRFVVVPTRTRDGNGQLITIERLLDLRVTIPAGTRSIAASAQLMAKALEARTGSRVSCCQAAVAGLPWGMAEVAFEAKNEPARRVLARLIEADSPGQSDRIFWLQRCDPLPSGWCSINLMNANGLSRQNRWRREIR